MKNNFKNRTIAKYTNCNNRNRLKYLVWFKKKLIILSLLNLLSLLTYSASAQAHSRLNNQIEELKSDDLTFTYKEKHQSLHSETNEQQAPPPPVFKTTRRPHMAKPVRTSTSKSVSKTQSTQKQTTQSKQSAQNAKQATQSAASSIQPPFTYSSESLNQTHANMFKNWIDSKSNELYELSMNYSGFKLLNATYNIQLRKDASFAWINFTEMIINISNTISEVLNHKTLIVKNLTDLVEKSFDEYRNDTRRVKESAHYLYYDAKSPKTFCDVQEASIQRAAKNTNHSNLDSKSTASTSILITTQAPIVTNNSSFIKQKQTISNITSKSFKKRHYLDLDDDIDFYYEPFAINYYSNESNECPYPKYFPHYHHNPKYHHHTRIKKQAPKEKEAKAKPGKPGGRPGGGGPGKGPSRRPGNMSMTRTTQPTTTAPASSLLYDDVDERTNVEAYDYFSIDYELSEKSPYWNITCINRTFDENFKSFQKGVNRNQSTVHVPTNVYKQDLDINMTAYWTEALDDLFKVNYENDNELFWQYFCSSNGLFRRYPGAYWTVPQNEDFFDCRLQSWYIMAAASPKDVLILLDVSGSMTGLRLEIAKKLVEAIMDTLSDNDFFNILIFSNTVDYLMNKDNETMYRERFIQAGRTNKKVFTNRLKWYKNTSNIANFEVALTKSFELLLSPDLQSDSCGCNKAIMILTDGASENAEQVFKKFNWNNGRQVRVFTFLIGREVMDPRQVEWMACANDGKFFHVATLADVNEHVHEYIPVLSRPMALLGHHETTWSNVFVGHLDKELKIAVARPAFKTRESLLSKVDLNKRDEEYFRKNKEALMTKVPSKAEASNTDGTQQTEIYDGSNPDYYNEYYGDYYQDAGTAEEGAGEEQKETVQMTEQEPKTEEKKTPVKSEENEEEENKILTLTDDILRKQQVLLGVVGVDVPVLRLISKVSPKYQMGVGIYIIMLDNNGFIVFHPSIKKEIASNDFNFKGTSNSIDLDRFEIPIDNDEDFEELEHEMIDQMTGNKTLDNWKREGLRVIRRRTEYVYTPVSKTPFSVAIASPSSFGRYYIDLPSEKESDYEKELKELMKNKFDSNIQLYNCSYNYSRLTEKILNPKQYMDYCIRYLFQDKDQVLAIKSDLVFHDIYYNLFNFSIFKVHPNLVKSSFYGTYSGITFYLPVSFYRSKMGLSVSQILNIQATALKLQSQATTTSSSSKPNVAVRLQTELSQGTKIYQPDITEPPSEMTINVELGPIAEPLFKKSTKPTPGDIPKLDSNSTNNETEEFHMSLNLFSTESNKHTYSFEKQYYTRSIEFSDYLRTEFNLTDPVVNYFLNESSKEARRDTVGATIPIWLDKVPTAVTGVVYDAQLLQYFLFENFMLPNCDHVSCRNLCSLKRGMNVTCYLVDEHGIVVLSTQERLRAKEPVMGQPLYKVNPWLMKTLEYEGIYHLVIPGKELPECRQESRIFNSSSHLRNIISLIFRFVSYLFLLLCNCFYKPNSSVMEVNAQGGANPSLADRIRMFNNEWRGKNSHCYNFGVYSFNLTKWSTLDSAELRVWCNSTNNIQRRFLVGYIKHSNLIMLVVEDEFELIHCGNITQLIRIYEGNWDISNSTNDTLVENSTTTSTTANTEVLLVKQTLLMPLDLTISSLNDSNFTSSSSGSNYSITKLTKKDFTINRYRKKPDQCYNFFHNEKEYLPCMSRANRLLMEQKNFCFYFFFFACYFFLLKFKQ